jgi:four helix bundle protein
MKNPDRWFITRFARELLIESYAFIRTLPSSERDNYFDQIQRAATSVDNNLGDGAGHQGDTALLPYLYHVNASASELLRCFRACRDLALGDPVVGKRCVRKAGRMQVMTKRLISKVERDIAEREARVKRRSSGRLGGGGRGA